MKFLAWFKRKPKEPLKKSLNVGRCSLLIETISGEKYVRDIVGIDNGPVAGTKGKQHNVYTVEMQVLEILTAQQGVTVANPHDTTTRMWIPFSAVKNIVITNREDKYIDVE